MVDRTLKLSGAINLRDFGGYATEDGRMVCRHRLYRSGTLSALTAEAQQAFAALGIDLICDLRRDDERLREPTPDFSHSPRKLEIPIEPGSSSRMSAKARTQQLTLADRIDFMVEINRDLARSHADAFASMFEALLELEDGAFLVHCSAGKDRTGFACALILHALGVAEETVLEDYLFTNSSLDFENYLLRLAAHYDLGDIKDQKEDLTAIIGVRPEYLQAAFEEIEAEFEGVENYLEKAIGLDSAAREVLRTRFLI